MSQELELYIIDPHLYATIDMLFYVNISSLHFLKNSDYSFSKKELWQKWRSVSMVENGKVDFVFWANAQAPDFLKLNTGKFITRE